MVLVSLRPTRNVTPDKLRITWRLLAIYFFALIVPLLSGAVIYLLQIREVEGEIRQSREKNLALNKRIVESSILLIEDIVSDIRQDTTLVGLASLGDPITNNAVLRVADAYHSSRLALPAPDYLIDVQVYLRRPDILLTLSDVYFDPAIYYRYFFRLEGWEYDEWISMMRSSEYVHNQIGFASVNLSGSSRETIVLMASLPYTTRIESVGRVAAYVDKDEIEALLQTYLAGTEGFAVIELADGRRLASAGDTASSFALADGAKGSPGGVYIERIAGREYAVSYIRSEVNQWLYASGTPVEVFFAQSRRVRVVFIAIALLVLFVGLPIAILQSAGVSRRIARASEVLKHGVVLSESISRNPFDFISDSVDELIKRDRSLRELLAEQKPYVQRVVLERLFRGQFDTEAEAHAFLSHFDVHTNGSRSQVLCVVVEGYFDVVTPEILNEFTVKSALVTEELDHLLPPRSLVHNVFHNVIGVAIFIDADGRDVDSGEDVDAIIGTVASRLRVLRGVRCTVTNGGVAEALMEIPSAVRRAIQRAEKIEPGANGLTSAKERGDAGYHYPTELESRLIRNVRAGAVDDVLSITAAIRAKNLTSRGLSRESLRRLYHEIDATRLKIERINGYGFSHGFAADPSAPIEEGIAGLLRHFEDLARRQADRGERGGALKEPIEAFIKENALDSEMGLKLLAMEFNLSEVYVSRLFKEQFGENFHSYVETIRMEQAIRLLRSSRLTVAEIADRVGYQSANTFRRVFKRRFGVAPSSFDRMPT